jgi:hypothetical protein
MVPVFLAGRILGKSGETHQKIKKDTGCQLHFMESSVRFQDYYTYKLCTLYYSLATFTEVTFVNVH